MNRKYLILNYLITNIFILQFCILPGACKENEFLSPVTHRQPILSPTLSMLSRQDYESIQQYADKQGIDHEDTEDFIRAILSFQTVLPLSLTVPEMLSHLAESNLNLTDSQYTAKVKTHRRDFKGRKLPVILKFHGSIVKDWYDGTLPTHIYFTSSGLFENTELSGGVAKIGIDLARAMDEKTPLWTWLKGKKTIGIIAENASAFISTTYGPKQMFAKGGWRLINIAEEVSAKSVEQHAQDYIMASVEAGFLGSEYLEGPDMVHPVKIGNVNDFMAKVIRWGNEAARIVKRHIIRPTTSSPDGFPHTTWRVTSLGAIAGLMPFIKDEGVMEWLGLGNRKILRMLIQGLGDVGSGIAFEGHNTRSFFFKNKPIYTNGVSDISGAVYINNPENTATLEYREIEAYRNKFLNNANPNVIEEFTQFSHRWINPVFILNQVQHYAARLSLNSRAIERIINSLDNGFNRAFPVKISPEALPIAYISVVAKAKGLSISNPSHLKDIVLLFSQVSQPSELKNDILTHLHYLQELAWASIYYQSKTKGVQNPLLFERIFKSPRSKISDETKRLIFPSHMDDVDVIIKDIGSKHFRSSLSNLEHALGKLHIALQIKPPLNLPFMDAWDNYLSSLRDKVKEETDNELSRNKPRKNRSDISLLNWVQFNLSSQTWLGIPTGVVTGFDINDMVFQSSEILVPASIPDGILSEQDVKKIKSPIVLEGANNYVSARASKFFTKLNKLLLYGPFSNGGGIKTSADEEIFFSINSKKSIQNNIEFARLINRSEIMRTALLNADNVLRVFFRGVLLEDGNANINDTILEVSRQISQKADELVASDQRFPQNLERFLERNGQHAKTPNLRRLFLGQYTHEKALEKIVHHKNVTRYFFRYFKNLLFYNPDLNSAINDLTVEEIEELKEFIKILEKSDWKYLGLDFENTSFMFSNLNEIGMPFSQLKRNYFFNKYAQFRKTDTLVKLAVFVQLFGKLDNQAQRLHLWQKFKNHLFLRVNLDTGKGKAHNMRKPIALKRITKMIKDKSSSPEGRTVALITLGHGGFHLEDGLKLIRDVIKNDNREYTDQTRATAISAYYHHIKSRRELLDNIKLESATTADLDEEILDLIRNIHQHHVKMSPGGKLEIDELGAWAHWTLSRVNNGNYKKLPYEYLLEQRQSTPSVQKPSYTHRAA